MKTTTVQVILLVVAVWCTYWPALSNGYMWDDHPNICENETLTRPEALRRIRTSDVPSTLLNLAGPSAMDQARATGQTALADQWGQVLLQYEAGRPHHQAP